MSEDNECNAQAIIDVMDRLDDAQMVGDLPHGVALAIVPKGREVKDLQPYIDALRDAPKRITTTALLTKVDSFIDYVNRFKTPDSAVFVKADDVEKLSITGIVDFHGQGADAAPRFGKHRAQYCFPISKRIKPWIDVSGEPLNSAKFATFLQDQQFDIANPPLDWMMVEHDTVATMKILLNLVDDGEHVDDGAPEETPSDDDEDGRYVPRSALYKLLRIRFGNATRLIQMSRTVEISANSTAKEGYNPKTGERTVEFTEEHTAQNAAGRRINVPDMILLRVPVFEGEQPQLIPVRLQYRKTSQGLFWFLTVIEWLRVIEMAVAAEADRVRLETSLPLFQGAP